MCHGRSWTPMNLAAQRLRDKAWRKRCAARLEASCPWIVHVSSMVYTRPWYCLLLAVTVSVLAWFGVKWLTLSLCQPSHTRVEVTIYWDSAGLDIGLVGPVARGASRFENLLAPQKTYWPPKKLTGPYLKTKLARRKTICINLQFAHV